MPIRREFDGVKYDSFYGRMFDEHGNEEYVVLGLDNEGMIRFEPSIRSISNIVVEMLRDHRLNKKVLLDKSPGYIDFGRLYRYFVPFHREFQVMLRDIVNNVLDESIRKSVLVGKRK